MNRTGEGSSFAAPRLGGFSPITHGLRRGLHSSAASRLVVVNPHSLVVINPGLRSLVAVNPRLRSLVVVNPGLRSLVVVDRFIGH